MRASRKNMIGVSLIEAILSLVIIASLITMGLKLYQSYSNNAAALRVKYNVEEIMRAAAMYYYSNCQNMPGATNAALDPANSPVSPVAITVASLVTGGYMSKAPAANPLVDGTGTNGGYLVQFIEDISDRNYCTTTGGIESCSKIGNNYNWRIQVSVLVKSTTTAKQYRSMTGADCTTSTQGTNKVVPCKNGAAYMLNCQTHTNPLDPAYDPMCASAGGTYNNYLSWERLPSMASPKGQSTLWMTNPVTKQFKQNAERPSLTYMLSNPNVTNFLCGS